jgi:peptide deformylase
MKTSPNPDLKDALNHGEKLKVFTYPAPVLKQIAKPVETFDDSLFQLCFNMLHTMYHAPGIGLAAPQVGQSLRIFVMDIDFERDEIEHADGSVSYEYKNLNPQIFINPVLSKHVGELLFEEGCLSVPGVYEKVKRAEKITVNFQDLSGNHHEIVASDVFSVCLQHENDHLDGIVFLERLSLFKRNFLTKKFLKNKR